MYVPENIPFRRNFYLKYKSKNKKKIFLNFP